MKGYISRISLGLLALSLCLSAVAGSLASVPLARAAETPELKRALLATVQIVVPIDGDRDNASVGSGSVLTSDGYILTNMHVIADLEGSGALYNKDGTAAIALNDPANLHAMPTFLYLARLVKGDRRLDLAVLKIVKPLNGKGSLPANLGLVTMPLADSSKVEFDDSVRCLGFPGVGGGSVTFTRGAIAGFLDRAADGSPLWFKSDAEVNRGNSGGAAIDEAGNAIGVPSMVVTDAEAAGQISLIRPINLAKPLIKAATAQATTTRSSTDETTAHIDTLFFTDEVDKQGRPGKAKTRFDPGIKALVTVFDYSNFEDGQFFNFDWSREGRGLMSDGLNWSDGEAGTTWVDLTSEKGLPQGTYQIRLSLEDQLLKTAKVFLGTPQKVTGTPSFGEITFAEGIDNQEQPVKPHAAAHAFDSGIGEVYAFFDYRNIAEGTAYSTTWSCDGEALLAEELQWEGIGGSGSYWLPISARDELPDGKWKLELSIEGKKAREGTFVVSGKPAATEEGVQLMGQILDADTKRPISGAGFFVLNGGVDPQAFLEDPQESMIYDWATTDREGRFTVDRLLVRGKSYVLVAGAKGYQPAVKERYTLAMDAESPLELTVRLQKR